MEIQKKCLWCGRSFIAHKITTKYCCHTCNSYAYKAQKRQERIENYIEEDNKKPIQVPQKEGEKPYLAPSEVSLLLGVSLATIYRYMATGILKALRIRARTRIRKSDLDKMFDENPGYKKRSYRRKESIPYYTLTEIIEKFKITKRTAYRRCEKYGIEKIVEGSKTFYNKALVDKHFADIIEKIDLSQFYTVAQVMEKYDMTNAAVCAFVMRYNIFRIKQHQKMYYSKEAIDAIKNKTTESHPDYYTYKEIMQKYGLTTVNISYYVNKYDLKRYKDGTYTFVSRVDFDRVMENYKNGTSNTEKDKEKTVKQIVNKVKPAVVAVTDPIPEGYCSAEEIAEKYKIVRKRVWKLTKQNNIPRISVKGIYYYENKGVEAFFNQFLVNYDVKEWITPKQMEELYNMTTDARRSFAHRHRIPTKLVYGNTMYSKDHIDKVKSNGFDDRDNYYSVTEAMEKFNLRRDEVYSFIRYNKIQKMRQGNTVFLLKSDFDRIINDKLSEL